MQSSTLLSQWWRVGGILGLAFFVVFLIGTVVLQGETPTYDDPVQEIRDFWEDDGQGYLVSDYVVALAITVLFLPFIVVLRTVLGRAEGGAEILSRTGFFGGLFVIAFAVAASASWSALAFAAENLSDDAIVALMYLDIGAWNTFPFAIGVWTLFSSIVIVQTGVLWRWLGILGLIIAVGGFITPLGLLDDDPEDIFDLIGIIPFVGLALWILITSIGLVMMKTEPQPAASAAGARAS